MSKVTQIIDVAEPPTAEQLAVFEARDQRDAMRREIESNAGDLPSLVGTTADAVELLLVGFSGLITALSDAQNMAAMRSAAKPYAEICQRFLEQVESGEVLLTYQVKGGADAVFEDVCQRSTAVAKVLKGASE